MDFADWKPAVKVSNSNHVAMGQCDHHKCVPNAQLHDYGDAAMVTTVKIAWKSPSATS